jgi:hypothetical protein
MSRMLRLWHSMNQNLLFTDPEQPYYIVRIVGRELIQDFQELDLDADVLQDDAISVMMEQATIDPMIAAAPAGQERDKVIQDWISANKDKYAQPRYPCEQGKRKRTKHCEEVHYC